MSSLTSETREVYLPVYYDENRNFIGEGTEYYWPDSAVEDAQEEISKYIKETGKYTYAVIERRVIPIYR